MRFGAYLPAPPRAVNRSPACARRRSPPFCLPRPGDGVPFGAKSSFTEEAFLAPMPRKKKAGKKSAKKKAYYSGRKEKRAKR